MDKIFSRYRFRVDPWSVDYGTGVQFSEEVQEILSRRVRVDASLEFPASQWKPVTPPALEGAFPGTVGFVDGVRRMELRLVQERASGGFSFGAVGAVAAGAVVLSTGQINFMSDALKFASSRRFLFAGSDADLPETIPIPVNYPPRSHFPISVLTISGTDPTEPLEALQARMRVEEGIVVEMLAESGITPDFIIADGPLSMPLLSGPPVLGYIKSLQAFYIEEALFPILIQLFVGERSPIFLIEPQEEQKSSVSRYSAYIRINNPGPRDTSLAGLVRLELSADLDFRDAQKLMNTAALSLPRFAAPAGYDPRAPQNLLPLGSLEHELRRSLGNSEMVRRYLEDNF